MSYSKVQFIAYRIYTGPGQNPERYVGLNDQAADVRLRVKLMTEALTTAAASSAIDPDPGTLKLFVAPEFFFRGMWGGYTDLKYYSGEGAGRDPNSVVGGLSDAIADPAWADWLCAFGTTVVQAAPFGAELDPETGASLAGKMAVLNVAFVQKGSYVDETERTAKSIAAVKEHMSDIDWLKVKDVVLGPKEVAHFPAVGPGSYAAEINTPGRRGGGGYNGGSIFMLDNITFGLEVCLDHAKQRLRRAAPQSGDFFIQLQLIPSGGMVVVPDSVATLQNGLVFNVDGLSSATAESDPNNAVYGFHSQLFQVTSVGQPSQLAQLAEIMRATRFPANADLNEVQQVFWIPPSNDPKYPDAWAPEIAIYPPTPIPAPTVARV